LPFVENLPTFAGAYFDHQARGELVILLTAADEALLENVRSLAPEGRPTRVEFVQYTQAQLREAVPEAWEAWKAAGAPEAYAISVDTPANAIRVDVDPANFEEAEKFVDRVSAAIGEPVFIGIGERPKESACTDRDHCTNPMRAGIVIRKGSVTSNTKCTITMGFHIQVGTDEQFVTAGHCGYSGSNNWYHQGYGFVGSELNTQYGNNNGRDIMSIQIPDTQDSSILYSGTEEVNGTWDPYVGEGLCASRGVSSPPWKCGVVQDDYLIWSGGACNCTNSGGDSSITFVSGDSGSPIVDAYDQYIAVGIANDSQGFFARVDDALADWGYTIRQP